MVYPLASKRMLGLPVRTQNSGPGGDFGPLLSGHDSQGLQYLLPPDNSDGGTGAANRANINALLKRSGQVNLVPGANYNLDSPIVMSSYQKLSGGWWASASLNDNYSAGTLSSAGAILTMTANFAGTAAIEMINSSGTQQGAVNLEGFTIEGFQTTGLNVYGINVQGAWGACFMRGVCIHRPALDCIRFKTDPVSGKIPDDWLITGCKFSASRTGYGVYAAELADSWFTDCESSENALDGWYVNYGIGTRFTGCKGENNGGAGFHFTGLATNQTQWLTGCGTHLNLQDGFLFDNAGPSGGGLGTYLLTGCVAENDGQTAAAGYAGFRAAGCRSRVILTGCAVDVTPGVGPQYGASQVGGSYAMTATGSYLQGVTTATHDDATNTHALLNQSPVPF